MPDKKLITLFTAPARNIGPDEHVPDWPEMFEKYGAAAIRRHQNAPLNAYDNN